MPLVHGGICREKVKVLLSIHVPNVHTFAALKNDWDGLIVFCTVLLLQRDAARRGRARRHCAAAERHSEHPSPEEHFDVIRGDCGMIARAHEEIMVGTMCQFY